MNYNNTLQNTLLNNSAITTEEFLNYIHSQDAQIYFNVNNITWKNKPQTYAKAAHKLLNLNHQGLDICYIVNSGGSKDKDITGINAVFADIDVGKDYNNKYYSDDVALNKKAALYKQYFSLYPDIDISVFSFSSIYLTLSFDKDISQSSLCPTFIIETRNGFQVYWCLHPGATGEEFRCLQQRIAHCFNSDTSVKNPARVMRLPGYNWCKSGSGCNQFYVGVKYFDDVRYSHSYVLDSFPSLPKETSLATQNQDKDRISTHNNIPVYKDNTWNIIVGTYRQVPSKPVLLKNMKHVIDYITKQNPTEYFFLIAY